jgi:hypothetical protein
MLTVKDAVRAAEEWVRDLFRDSDLRHFRLEEVQLSDDERRWLITLGWAEPGVRENGLAAALGRDLPPRVYKTLEVDADSGLVRSMKIRDP